MTQVRRRNPGEAMKALVDGKKVCRGCGQEKALDYFHVNRRAGDGRHTRCKDCISKYMKSGHEMRDRVGRPLLEAVSLKEYRCSACGIVKASAEFPPNSSAKRGHSQYCRDCISGVSRVYGKRRWANPVSRWKMKVRNFTNLAIELGFLVPKPCESCGVTDVQAHHVDYSKPLDVRWLCRRHHMDIHRETGGRTHA